jgi:ubiquinone/menaquinone biosynthesis C-methylase UbiE
MSVHPWSKFLSQLAVLKPHRVLEIGTRRWKPDHATTRRLHVQEILPDCTYVGLDIQDGDDVDVVCDAHTLSTRFPANHFGGFICRSTLEHLRRPWVVARELAAVVQPGGIGYVETHQTFPLHNYPADYFRFSTGALEELFSQDVGWTVERSSYHNPCRIMPTTNAFAHANDWSFEAEAWLNVVCVVRRLSHQKESL